MTTVNLTFPTLGGKLPRKKDVFVTVYAKALPHAHEPLSAAKDRETGKPLNLTSTNQSTGPSGKLALELVSPERSTVPFAWRVRALSATGRNEPLGALSVPDVDHDVNFTFTVV